MFSTQEVESEAPIEVLERQIVELGAQIAAATYRWLTMVGELDRRRGWEVWECRSAAHWLNWKCGIDLRSAHEKVRVARALPGLPVISKAFEQGELSYSKVRALTRVATAASEASLVEMARYATASHIERIVRAYRGVLATEDVSLANVRHANRYLRWHHDDDGSVVIQARLSPEDGALVIEALTAAMDTAKAEERSAEHETEQRRAAEHSSAERSAERNVVPGDHPAEAKRDPEARSRARADAVVAVAESFLASGPRQGNGDAYQVVVHVADTALRDDDPGGCCALDGGPSLATETARRIACDAAIVTLREAADGTPLDIGRKSRSISPSMRRALRARDHGCRFPGCTQRRFVDGHHIRHWSKGGETKLSNLAQLCRYHHRLVHEGGYTMEWDTQADLHFRRPDGTTVAARPVKADPHDSIERRNLRAGLRIDHRTGESLWAGDKLDLDLVIDGLLWTDGRHSDQVRERAVAVAATSA